MSRSNSFAPRAFAALFMTLGATLAAAQAQGMLPAPIGDALRTAGIPLEAVSMLVWPVDGARPRLEHLSQVSRQPASVIKLFTTGTALLTWGPAFTWRTDVALGGPLLTDGTLAGPLYLRGSGDPSLVLENVWLMMSRWRAAGLRDIQGGIVLDRSAFDVPPHDPAAFDNAPLKPYNAGPDALMLNHQAITLRLMPDSARPERVRITMEPALDGVRLESQVLLKSSGDCGAWRERLSIDMQPGLPAGHAPSTGEPAPWTLSVRGIYPQACEMREWPLLWQGGPGDHAARLLGQMWRDLGGRIGHASPIPVVKPAIRDGIWPEGATVWQSWVSPPLLKVVQDINKFSNNVMARQLFLAMSPQPGPATLDKAREAVNRVVREATRGTTQDAAPEMRNTARSPTPAGAMPGGSPCEGDALVLDNGSGLSRQEHSSAACLGRWLQALWNSPVMPELLSSLPVTGVDGTARRLGLSGALGRAHIKTGSLEGVMAIAGIVHGESGRRHIVVAIVNHPKAQGARPAMDALLGWAARDDAARTSP